MDEFAAADVDAYVGRSRFVGAEEDEVAVCEVAAAYGSADFELAVGHPRQLDAEIAVDVRDEA